MAGANKCKKCCMSTRKFIWNPDKKLLFKRSRAAWVQFFLFYFGILLILIAVTGLWSAIILHFLSHYQTPWWGTSGNNPNNPNLSLRPTGKDNLIAYIMGDVQRPPHSYINEMKTFLKKYEKQSKGITKTMKQDNHKNCSESCLNSPKPCHFDISSLGPCAKVPYGYDTGDPCVLIKLNKV